jgi:hypothetical protein
LELLHNTGISKYMLVFFGQIYPLCIQLSLEIILYIYKQNECVSCQHACVNAVSYIRCELQRAQDSRQWMFIQTGSSAQFPSCLFCSQYSSLSAFLQPANR